MTDARPQVAIAGVGTMGRGIADSLLRAGFTPALWDRDPKRLAAFQGTEARSFESVRDAVADAEIVITMVSDADAVIDVAQRRGMMAALAPGAIWAQMSTIGATATDRVAGMVTELRPDVHFVDAPVSGSRDAAASGSLTILASGPDAVRARLAPVFVAIGRRTMWLGPAGVGSRLKLANNTMVAFIVQGLSEALGVAHRLDITTTAVAAAFESAAFASPYLSDKLLRIEHGDYDAEFSLALALKDVKLALDAVDPARHPVLEALANQWQEASDDGLGSQDVTAIARVLVEPG